MRRRPRQQALRELREGLRGPGPLREADEEHEAAADRHGLLRVRVRVQHQRGAVAALDLKVKRFFNEI